MDANQLLDDVAGLLERYRPVSSGRYLLFVGNEGIALGLESLFRNRPYIIATLISRDVNEGPTPRLWHSIEDKIRIFVKQGVL